MSSVRQKKCWIRSRFVFVVAKNLIPYSVYSSYHRPIKSSNDLRRMRKCPKVRQWVEMAQPTGETYLTRRPIRFRPNRCATTRSFKSESDVSPIVTRMLSASSILPQRTEATLSL